MPRSILDLTSIELDEMRLRIVAGLVAETFDGEAQASAIRAACALGELSALMTNVGEASSYPSLPIVCEALERLIVSSPGGR